MILALESLAEVVRKPTLLLGDLVEIIGGRYFINPDVIESIHFLIRQPFLHHLEPQILSPFCESEIFDLL